jgi:hypothetical protein
MNTVGLLHIRPRIADENFGLGDPAPRARDPEVNAIINDAIKVARSGG